MTLRTVLFSLALAASALAAPPALGTAHACGGYGEYREHAAGQAVVAHLVKQENRAYDAVEIVSATSRDDGFVSVSARIHVKEGRAMRRLFTAKRVEGTWRVFSTHTAWVEHRTEDGWVRV
jgi:hypothetical protein